MEVKAKARYIRMSPKKVRLVLDVIRGMGAEEALSQLRFINKAAARPVKKLLDSAIANATNNFGLKRENLFIKKLVADEGPTLKRWRPRAFGRATPIRKRSSHISIILEEKVPSKEVRRKKQKVGAPVKIAELAKGGEKQSEDRKLKMEDREKEEKRKKKGEKRTGAGEEVKLDEQGRLKRKERQGLDEMRKKERKGFFRSMFSRKTG